MDYRKKTDNTTNKDNSKNTTENNIEDIEYVRDEEYIDNTEFIDDVISVDVDADSKIDTDDMASKENTSNILNYSSKSEKLEKENNIKEADNKNDTKEAAKLLESLKGNYNNSEENIVKLDNIRKQKNQKNTTVNSNIEDNQKSKEQLKQKNSNEVKIESKNQKPKEVEAEQKEQKPKEVKTEQKEQKTKEVKAEQKEQKPKEVKVEQKEQKSKEAKVEQKEQKLKEAEAEQSGSDKDNLTTNNNIEYKNKVESKEKLADENKDELQNEVAFEKKPESKERFSFRDKWEARKNKKKEQTKIEENTEKKEKDMDKEKIDTNSTNIEHSKNKRLDNIASELGKASNAIEDNKIEINKKEENNSNNKIDNKNVEVIKEKNDDKSMETKMSSGKASKVQSTKSEASTKPVSFTERMMQSDDEDNKKVEDIKTTKEIKLGSSEEDIRMEEYVRPEAKQLKKVIPDERKKSSKKDNKDKSDSKNKEDKKSSKDTIRIYQKRRADNGTTFVWNDPTAGNSGYTNQPPLNNSYSNTNLNKTNINGNQNNSYVNSNLNNEYMNNNLDNSYKDNINVNDNVLSEDSEIEYTGSNISKILHFKIVNRLFQLVKWILVSVFIGVTVGIVSVAFARSMTFVTNLRTNNDWIIYFLPVGGIAIVYMYHKLHYKNDKGTNAVIAGIRAEEDVPIKMAPLIFFSTIITHLFGGSAGREGAALQLGGSIGNQLGKFINLDDKDRRVVLMAGMSAAFSAIFGTPIAATVFSMEMASIGIMHYSAFVPCAIASLVASELANALGVHAEFFEVLEIPDINILIAGKIILLAICCAAISVVFCMLLHIASDYSKKIFKNPYVRIVLGAIIILGLALLLNTRDYMGAGINIIEDAMKGEVKPEAFVLKMLFTVITLSVGYKGGEIVPSFFIGATFGCLFGQILNFSPSFSAALGMVAVFCGVTNCPITSLLISFELFGYKGVYYFLLTIPISYMMSGYTSLYKSQKIMYSKFKTQYINKTTSK